MLSSRPADLLACSSKRQKAIFAHFKEHYWHISQLFFITTGEVMIAATPSITPARGTREKAAAGRLRCQQLDPASSRDISNASLPVPLIAASAAFLGGGRHIDAIRCRRHGFDVQEEAVRDGFHSPGSGGYQCSPRRAA